MANSKDNISKYATSFIGFDEASGSVYDNIGGYVGTTYNAPTRVAGWNGEGYAMSFNGSNQYVLMNSPIIPLGNKTIRLKFKKNSTNIADNDVLFCTSGTTDSTHNGFYLTMINDDLIFYVVHNGVNVGYKTNMPITDTDWHDYVIKINGNTIEFYLDQVLTNQHNTYTEVFTSQKYNLYIGSYEVLESYNFNGCIDSIEFYDQSVSIIHDKHLVLHGGQYKYHDGTQWQSTTATEENFIKYGHNDLSHITETQWQELQGSKSIAVWSDFEDKQYVSAVLEKEPFVAKDIIGDNAELILHTTSTAEQALITTEIDGYSVYDYISELPQVVAYTESTDDIIVSTTTEPFDLYDEFGDEVEVLFYTNDEAVTEADLILEANWSPVDELDGDFEIVTWTDESSDTTQRVLEMTAIPKPQFLKLTNPKRLYGSLEEVLAIDASMSYMDEVRYLFTDEKETAWYTWDFNSKSFVEVDSSTHELISKNGMKYNELSLLTKDDWSEWKFDYINIGIFLKDNPRDTIISVVESVSYEDYLPRHSTEIEKANFYILNTTARIDINIEGNTIQGSLSDDDLTRVQYRVLLNGNPYYPVNGNFTELSAPPQNIALTFGSNEIIMDDWNTVKVEFRDFFGTVDYWQTNFIGTYSGIMFKDIHGDYYSTEIGEVLKYLDFGIIIAGQTTIQHEIILKNQYGYDVNNIHLYANTSEFPVGMSLDFSRTSSPFTPEQELKISDVLKHNDEISFFVRISTDLIATPNANGVFDIIVKADKV